MTRTSIKKNRRVLIAGAKFGEMYLNAFLRPQPGLVLAGLLARGSRRAQQLAHDFGIPLYTSLEQIPDDIDIACVVVRSTVAQGEGSQLAADLLSRDIHVLQEHPLHPDDVVRLQALARERGLTYWINSFYPHVPAGRCWVKQASRIRSLLGGQMLGSAQLTTSRQLLYSTLDLLLQACGAANGSEVRAEALDGSDDSFVPLRLTLPGECQALLRLQSYLNPSDPDMFSLVMHQASLIWPSGYLTLEASYGPVLWTGTFHDPEHGSRERTMYRYANEVGAYAQPTSMILHEAPGTWRDAFEIDGADGITHVLRTLCRVLDGANAPVGFGPTYQLALARLWLDILRIAPPVVERHLPPPRTITRDDLIATAPGQEDPGAYMDSFLSLCGQPIGRGSVGLHLVLCPFAGGSASAFRSWRELQPAGIQASLAVYPGRDHRMNEPCAASIADLANQVLAEIEAQGIDRQQLILAGHSMGAQIAYEVCVRLERKGSAPRGLVLSGCHAPHLRGRRPISHLEDRAFLEQLVAIGGCTQELLAEPAMWPVFMPMLRADFQATEGYWQPQPPPPAQRLQTPALLVYGGADSEAWRSEVDAWKTWLSDTHGPVSIAGDHFYVTRRPRAFLEHIRRRFEPHFAHAQACTFK